MLGCSNWRYIQGRYTDTYDVYNDGKNRLAENTFKEKDKGKNNPVIVDCQSYVSRIIIQAEDIEITQPYCTGSDYHERSRQEPGTEFSIAQEKNSRKNSKTYNIYQ